MRAEVQIKIKLDNCKEIILNDCEAYELYLKLKEVYEKSYVTIGYPVPVREVVPYFQSPFYPNAIPTTVWYSSSSNVKMSY
jgi:hypothetical protein